MLSLLILSIVRRFINTLEVIDGIPLDAAKIDTDGTKQLTDSRSSIQHLSNWPSIGDSTLRIILPYFNIFGSAPDSSTVGSFSSRPSRTKLGDDIAKADTSNLVDPEDHMVPNRLRSAPVYSAMSGVFLGRRLLHPPAVLRRYTDLWTRWDLV
ncbi:hypothetical protein TNCV_2161561 [Trichonephila clavipes]|nr:hypothetical protein TNCV_2161561 [Trichonephila clavipes]